MRKEWTKNEETNARQTDTWFERLEKSRCNIGVQDMRAVDGDETGFIWTKACNQPFPRTGRRVKLAASTLQVVYIAFKMPVYPVRFIDEIPWEREARFLATCPGRSAVLPPSPCISLGDAPWIKQYATTRRFTATSKHARLTIMATRAREKKNSVAFLCEDG